MSYKHGQVVWDLKMLSFHCQFCKRRIPIGAFEEGYKTVPSVYRALLLAITIRHEESNCKFENIDSGHQWRWSARRRSKEHWFSRRRDNENES